MEMTVDIKQTGIESAILCAPFDRALTELQKNDYKLISLPKNAQLRIQQGKDHYVSKNGNWVKEGILYVPGERSKLVRVSPILESAKEATHAHRTGKEFYPTKEQIEQSLTDSVDFPEKIIRIPTNRFDWGALTVYAFGGEKKAKAYGEFLDDAGIKEMPVYAISKDYVNKQSQPFIRQLWLGDLYDGSDFDGYHWPLGDSDSVRGVKVDAEGTSQENKK